MEGLEGAQNRLSLLYFLLRLLRWLIAYGLDETRRLCERLNHRGSRLRRL